jgi:hypothetical protein
MPTHLRHHLPRPEVTDVCVQRVQEISVADIRAEGIPDVDPDEVPAGPLCTGFTTRINFASLWDSINAKPKPAKHNPWGVPETCQIAYPWDDVQDVTTINHKSSQWHGCKVYVVGNPFVRAVTFRRLEDERG